MKLLVTGGAGFIGRSLVRLLAERGDTVVVLDSYRFSQQSQVKKHPNITWVQGDTREKEHVFALVKGCDAVMHLAAPSSFLMHVEDDLEACSFTMMGFKTVMEAVRNAGIKKVVWASTSAVYEGHDVPYTEDMVLAPPDSKAGCKVWCEQEAQRYSDRFDITCIGMRPYSVYGKGEHTKRGYANVISLFAWAMMNGRQPVLWGDGSQTRDYIYVEDAARAFIAALDADIPTQCLNVGTGIETTFNEVVTMIGEELGIEPKPTFVPIPIKIYALRLWADMTRVKSVLNFEPRITVREGVRRVIEYAKTLPLQTELAEDQMYFKSLPGATRTTSKVV
jgi:nucleoside-diphosphate-sugar epimerase